MPKHSFHRVHARFRHGLSQPVVQDCKQKLSSTSKFSCMEGRDVDLSVRKHVAAGNSGSTMSGQCEWAAEPVQFCSIFEQAGSKKKQVVLRTWLHVPHIAISAACGRSFHFKLRLRVSERQPERTGSCFFGFKGQELHFYC